MTASRRPFVDYDPNATAKYQCWCPYDNRLPNQVIEAASSFLARKEYARRHHKQVTDCIARRKYEAD